jgi:hypothetical protein
MAAMGWWEKSRIHQALKRLIAGPGIEVDSTTPSAPVVSAKISTDPSNALSFGTDDGLFATGGGGSSGHSPGCVFSNVLAATTVTSEIQIPYGGNIEGWTIVGDVAGSVSIAVSRATYANYDTMTSLFTATCTTSKKAQATGLSHTLTAGDILRFTASGFASFARCTITLEVT